MPVFEVAMVPELLTMVTGYKKHSIIEEVFLPQEFDHLHQALVDKPDLAVMKADQMVASHAIHYHYDRVGAPGG